MGARLRITWSLPPATRWVFTAPASSASIHAQFVPSGLNDTANGGSRNARFQKRLPVWRSAVPTKVEYQNTIFEPEMNRPPLALPNTHASVGCSGSFTSRMIRLDKGDALPDMSTSGSRGTGVDLHENFG